MAIGKRCYAGGLAMLALGLGATLIAAESGAHDMKANAADGPIRCEIQVKSLGGAVELQGVVFADAAGHGAYELQVSKSGGGGQSNINQAGGFDARPEMPARLGIVMLGGDDSTYRAKLKVVWRGEEFACEKTIGGGWL